MRLRTKKSHIQNLSEGRAPHRILPVILKFAYYMILIGILVGLSYVVIIRYLFFDGRGQVEVEKITISSAYGGRIKSIERQSGNKFAAGDILAVIDTGIECHEPEPDTRFIRLVNDIQLKQSERNIYSDQLKMMEKGTDSDILPRALEIGDAYSMTGKKENYRELKRLQEKIDLLSVEIAVKKKELADLKREKTAKQGGFCGLETVKAAFDGTIRHVSHQPSEFIKEGAPLFIVIPKDSKVAVEAFFQKKHLQYLSIGKTMKIKFPDRTSSMGKVVDFLSAASYFAERTQKDYLPVEAMLRVNIVPVEPTEAAHWKRYDRMDVIVEGKR